MKVEQFSDNSIKSFGNIEENRVGIDRENVDFITTLLTSNLYSAPLVSFLRETVSNAYDAQVEAGNETAPIIVLIKHEYSQQLHCYDVSVRDYGTGISPERFKAIYTNIGSSTKRGTNDYIGGWGIGRFSALAVSDNVIINSYYNGIKYSYLMHKNGSSINIDKVNEQALDPGEFKQGVEVIATNVSIANTELETAVEQLAFFENLVIESRGLGEGAWEQRMLATISQFNDRKCTMYKYCAFSSLTTYRAKVLVGRVLYPLDDDYLLSHSSMLFNWSRPLVLRVGIGSVHITPNREALRYSDKTKNALQDSLANAIIELQEMLNKSAASQFPNLNSFANMVMHKDYFTVVEPYEGTKYSAPLDKVMEYFKVPLVIDGDPIPEKIIAQIKSLGYWGPEMRVLKIGGSRRGGRTGECKTHLRNLLAGVLFEKKDARTASRTYRFYEEQWASHDAYIVSAQDLNTIIDSLVPREERYSGAGECTDFVLKHLAVRSFSNAEVPDSFQVAKPLPFKAAPNRRVIEGRRYLTSGAYITSTWYNMTSDSKLIVYSPNTREDDLIRYLAAVLAKYRVCFVTLPKIHMDIVPHNRKFMPLSTFLSEKNTILSKFFSYCHVRENVMDDLCKHTCSTTMNRTAFLTRIKNDGVALADLPKELLLLYNKYVDNKWLDYTIVQESKFTDRELKLMEVLNQEDNYVTSFRALLIASGMISLKDMNQMCSLRIDKSRILRARKLLTLLTSNKKL